MNDQRSIIDQLRDAVAILNREGLHDAADFCRLAVERVDALRDGRRCSSCPAWIPVGDPVAMRAAGLLRTLNEEETELDIVIRQAMRRKRERR